MPWGSPTEIERRRRIRVAVWAYAYEYMDTSLVPDATFDRECQLVDLSISTGNRKMDAWFRKNFVPYTGQWVHDHPDKRGLERIARAILEHQQLEQPE